MAFSAPTVRGEQIEGNAAASTITVTLTGTIPAGRVAVVLAWTTSISATDGATTDHTSLVDNQNSQNIWQKVGEWSQSSASATDGCTISIWQCLVRTAMDTGVATQSSTLTTSGNTTERGLAILEVTASLGNGVNVAAAVVGQNTLTAATGTITSREYFLVHTSASRGSDNTKTAGTNYTERFDNRSRNNSLAVAWHAQTRIATLTSDSTAPTGWTTTANTIVSAIVAFWEAQGISLPTIASTATLNTPTLINTQLVTLPTIGGGAPAQDGFDDDPFASRWTNESQCAYDSTNDEIDPNDGVDDARMRYNTSIGFLQRVSCIAIATTGARVQGPMVRMRSAGGYGYGVYLEGSLGDFTIARWDAGTRSTLNTLSSFSIPNGNWFQMQLTVSGANGADPVIDFRWEDLGSSKPTSFPAELTGSADISVTDSSGAAELNDSSRDTYAGIGGRTSGAAADQRIDFWEAASTEASGAQLFAPTVSGAAGGDQGITTAHIASTETLFAPTVAQTLELPVIASTATLFAQTLEHVVSLVHISSTLALFAPILALNLSLPVIASTAATFAPDVAQTLVLPSISSTAATFAPTITPGDVTLTGAHIASTNQLFTPSFTLNITGAHISSTETLFAPTVAQTLVLPVISSTITLFAPTLEHAITLSHIASTVQLFTPSLALNVDLPHISSTVQLFTPTLEVGPAGLTLPHIASTIATFAPELISVIELPHISSTNQLFTPALALNISGAHISSTAAVFAPTLEQTLVLPTISSTVQLFAPTITAGAVTLSLPTIASTVQLFTPDLTHAVTLPHISSTAQLFTLDVAQTLVLPVIASTAQLFTPTVAETGAVLLPVIDSTAQLFTPSLDFTITLAHIASTATLFAPDVAQTLVLPTIASTAQLFAPTLEFVIVTAHISSTAQLFAPTVAADGVLILPTIESTTQLFAPVLVPGEVSITLPVIASTNQLFAPVLELTLVLPVIDSTIQTFAPTLAQTLTLPVIASTAVIFAPELIHVVTLPTIASTAQLFTPSFEDVILPPHISSTAQLFAFTVSPGAVEVILPHIGSTAQPYPVIIAQFTASTLIIKANEEFLLCACSTEEQLLRALVKDTVTDQSLLVPTAFNESLTTT